MPLLRKPVLFSSLILSAGFAGGAWATPLTESDVRAFMSRLQATGWITSVESVQASGNQLVLHNLKVSTPDKRTGLSAQDVTLAAGDLNLFRISLGGLEIRGLALNSVLDDHNELELVIPHITGGNADFPTFAHWALDENRPLASLATALSLVASVELDALDVKEIIFRTWNPQSTHAALLGAGTVADFHAGPMHTGNLATVSLGKMTARFFPASPPDTAMSRKTSVQSFETLRLEDVNFANLAAAYDPAAYAGGKGDTSWKNGFKSLTLKGFANVLTLGRNSRETTAIAAFTLGPLSVRQTSVQMAGPADTRIATRNFDKPLDVSDSETFETQVLPLLHTWRLESALVSKFSFTGRSSNTTITLDSTGLQGLSADGLDHFGLNGLALKSDNFGTEKNFSFDLSLASAELQGVVWPSIVAWLSIAALSNTPVAQQGPAHKESLARLDPLQLIPIIASSSLNNLSLAINDVRAFSLNQARGTTTVIQGDQAVYENQSQLRGLYLGAPLLGLDPDIRAAVDDLGYSEFNFDWDYSTHYEIGTTGNLRTNFALAGQDVGRLVFSYGIDGLTAQRLTKILASENDGKTTSGNLEAYKLSQDLTDGLGFAPFLLRFEDASLTGRMFTTLEKSLGTDHATMVAKANAMATLAITQINDVTFTQEATRAVSDFLSHPKSISIRMNPPKPVLWSEVAPLLESFETPPLTNLPKLIGLVGLHITAND